MKPSELVTTIRSHALAHYYQDGWDTVVECYTDAEILEVVGNCTTSAGAIRKMKSEIAPGYAYGNDIRATAF